MDLLTKDVLFNIATMLDLDDLSNFCSSDSRINRLICQDKNIWNFKLMKEFPDYKVHINQRGREAYELLLGLTKLKKEFEYKGTIYELYKETKLNLSRKSLISLPPEIGNLSNLQELYLGGNNIEILPLEIENLSQLRQLWLNNNQITSLPSEIGNLTNLNVLWLHNNQIKSLPSEIGNLSKLQVLYLDKSVIIPPGLKLPITYW